MGDQSASSRLQVPFEAALQDYETKTGVAIDKHPFAKELQTVTPSSQLKPFLANKQQACNEFRGKDKILSKTLYHPAWSGCRPCTLVGLDWVFNVPHPHPHPLAWTAARVN